MSTSACVGMTFTASPAGRMVGVNVAPSSGSMSEASSGSAARSSATAARAVAGSLRRARRSPSVTRASMRRRRQRGDDGRRVGQAQGDDGAGQVYHRAALLLGDGAVAAAAARADAELREGLLADGQQEHLAAVDRQPQAAHALVDEIVAAQQVGALAAQPLDAAELAVLLVRRGGEGDGAGEVRAGALETGEGDGLGRDLVLHVGGAAAPHVAVLHDAAERRHAPFGGVRRHHVQVAHQGQRGSGTGALEAGDEVLAIGQLAEHDAVDAVVPKVVPQDRRAGGLVAVDGVHTEERREEVEDLALEGAPRRFVQTVVGQHTVLMDKGEMSEPQ